MHNKNKEGQVKRLLFRGLLLSLLAIAGGCQELPILEITETDESSQISLNVVSEILSTFDIVQDWSTGDLLFLKKDESLMPSDVVISYLDTSFIDGDGIKLGFDFGFLGQSPNGLLCKDGKYRAGYFTVSLNRHPQEIDAKLVIEFPEDNPFYSGDGVSMTEISGAMVVKRISDDELKLTASQLSVKENTEEKKSSKPRILPDVLSNIVAAFAAEYRLLPWVELHLDNLNWKMLSMNPNAIDILKNNLEQLLCSKGIVWI